MVEVIEVCATSREAILKAREANKGRVDREVYGTRRLKDGRCEVIKTTLP